MLILNEIDLFLLVMTIIFLLREGYFFFQKVLFVARNPHINEGYNISMLRLLGILLSSSYIITYVLS